MLPDVPVLRFQEMVPILLLQSLSDRVRVFQHFSDFFKYTQIDQVVGQEFPHQKFCGNVVQFLSPSLCFIPFIFLWTTEEALRKSLHWMPLLFLCCKLSVTSALILFHCHSPFRFHVLFLLFSICSYTRSNSPTLHACAKQPLEDTGFSRRRFPAAVQCTLP